MKSPGWWQTRIRDPLKKLLMAGLTPHAIGLSGAFGCTIGISPLIGTTTIQCLVLAPMLGLNLIAIQVFNWLVAGLQLLLIVPFIRIGEWLFRATTLSLSPVELRALFDQGLLAAAQTLGWSMIHALTGWLVCAPLVFAGAYLLVRRMAARYQARIRPTSIPA